MVDLRLRACNGIDVKPEANATCRVWSKPRYEVDPFITADETADVVKLSDFRQEGTVSTEMAA